MSQHTALYFTDPSTGNRSPISSAIGYIREHLNKLRTDFSDMENMLLNLGVGKINANNTLIRQDIEDLASRLTAAIAKNVAQDKRLDALESGAMVPENHT
jgi:hypothetical protein